MVGSPLRRDAGVIEEEAEYSAIHGQRPVDADEEAVLERASSRGMKEHILTRAQAGEVPVECGRESEKRHFREEFEVRLLDVTNGFGT